MSAANVCPAVRRIGSGVASGDVYRLDPSGVRLLLRALLFDGAGVPSWHALASCRGMDEALFFPPGDAPDCGVRIAAAKAVCAGCPVRRECLDDAMGWEQPSTRVGVRGGLSAAERQRRYAARKAVAA